MQILAHAGVEIYAFTSQIGDIAYKGSHFLTYPQIEESQNNPVHCPDPAAAKAMQEKIMELKAQQDTVGGVVSCVISGLKAGIGEPVYGKLQAQLAAAMMSINAAKGFEYGDGFESARATGSQQIDNFYFDEQTGRIRTLTNHSGGIQGGITNGEDIYFRVAFKPAPTLLREVSTVDDEGNETILKMQGRHDPCVVPRAVAIVEAMAAMTVLDALMMHNARQFAI